MKRALGWLLIIVALYVVSSGPALLLARTPAWNTLKLDRVYWPLSQLVDTPAYLILLPYWDLFHDREMNPLIPG